ncbi:MAG: dTDP-4-dehydrorhamnose 3,5-epimerase [Candidatus Margulisbacteria bacterium]|nr:dTDP-4-dehydrorhamnose 3,5-epimerase [Candidatus Margulisiibacteriota bacterium]
MGQFIFSKADIPGILIIEAKPFRDNRGFFRETYNLSDFEKNGFTDKFVQDNHSWSNKGVVRGLHYQIKPSPMGKLVACFKGKIFDVGVDIRKGSPTFGKWYGEILSGDNMKMLYFPPGFAHGFLCLEDDTHVYYKCTGMYSQKNERAMIWNDPEVGIKWPLDEVGGKVILSEKDQKHPPLKGIETNYTFKG